MFGQLPAQPAATAADARQVAVHPGRTYRVQMALERAAGTSPSWIVTAMRASYPGAEIAKVEHYDDTKATVLVTWKGQPGKILIGDSVAPMIQGLQVPFEALPMGTIQSAQQVDLVPGGIEQAISKTNDERAIVLRLALAGAVLVATWYLSSRVKHQ